MGVYHPRCAALLDVLLEDFQGGRDTTVRTFEAAPRSVEVERNAARRADTFSLELDWRDFPLDPRTLRSVVVAVALADVGRADGALSAADADARVLLGVVDDAEVRLEDAGEVVRLTGRDYTAFFLDHPWGGAALAIDRPLDQVLAEVLAAVPGVAELAVDFADPAAAALVLSSLLGRSRWVAQARDDAWTVLVDLLAQAGLVPVIDQDVLRVVPPSWFGTRRVGFLYGRDLSRLSYRRKAVQQRTAQVVVRAWDAAAGAAREARWPTAPTQQHTKVSSAGEATAAKNPVTSFFLAGSYTEAQLEQVARDIAEAAAREQIEGELETREMAADDFALPQLVNGDRVELVLGKADTSEVLSLDTEAAVARLSAPTSGMDPTVARALVESARSASALLTTFYVKTARHRWSREEGYTLTVGFINQVPGPEQS